MGNTSSICCLSSRSREVEKNGDLNDPTNSENYYSKVQPRSNSFSAQYRNLGQTRNDGEIHALQDVNLHNFQFTSFQHLDESELEEHFEDPTGDPHVESIFLWKFSNMTERDRRAHRVTGNGKKSSRARFRKYNSCSSIYIDDSTASQPNLKNTIKCVSLAIYYHIRNRNSDSDHNTELSMALEIFNEKLHPLTVDYFPEDYGTKHPEHRAIYKFLSLLFDAVQLTSEVAIITLIYLERLLYYAEIEINPIRWKRMVLGAVLLASKVWDDQAVWNADYCEILENLEVQDMNELERQYLEMIQFNINVPSGVYAKYYFDLRTLSHENGLHFPVEPLDKNRAAKLKATTQICDNKRKRARVGKQSSSLEHLKRASRLSTVVIS